MTDSMKAFWLGMFILIAAALTAWFLLFLKPNVGDGKNQLTVRFTNIDKINRGTVVTFGGQQVGQVKEIRMIEDFRQAPQDDKGNLYLYELTLNLDSAVNVHENDEVLFATAGLLGEKSIAIIPKAVAAGQDNPLKTSADVIYGNSSDKLDQALTQMVDVAATFQDTLLEVDQFLTLHRDDIQNALQSLNSAAVAFNGFIARANETEIIDYVKESCQAMQEAAEGLSQGEGTFSQLMNNQNLYVQLQTVLGHLETVLHDISNYGIFYQFSSKWSRLNEQRKHYAEMPVGTYSNK